LLAQIPDCDPASTLKRRFALDWVEYNGAGTTSPANINCAGIEILQFEVLDVSAEMSCDSKSAWNW